MSNKTENTNTAHKTDIPSMPNMFASFDPMAMWGAGQQAFTKMMTEAFGRAQSFADEYATIESQMIGRAQGAVDSWAQMVNDAISYGAQLSAQARKVGFEAARKFAA